MDLVIQNKQITSPILDIVKQVKKECSWDVFHEIKDHRDYISVTCPFHKDGMEKKPSCSIYARYDNDEVAPGVCHCFTCGAKMPIQAWIGKVFGYDDAFGEEWLVARFGDVFITKQEYLPEIVLSKPKETYLPETYLMQYAYIHPYMYYRKLNDFVINKFQIGYDRDTDCITFPIRDEKGRLLGVTERSVRTKYFYIPDNIQKPVYLLNYVLDEGYTSAIICESQIDALTCWAYGYVACAMLGTGSAEQYQVLNKSPIRNYVLMFDGDPAGRKGARNFQKYIRNDVFVENVKLPEGKDINNLNKFEFDTLLKNYGVDDCLRINSCT